MSKISVIVPVYNVEKWIERCARSLFEQTLDDIEYIFVDDCSTDNSIHVLKNIANEYPERESNIKYLHHKKNTGQSGARRDGMAIATGDYIIHCDADDWVDVDMYESMYQKAVESNADAVVCDILLEMYDSTKCLNYNAKYEDHRLMYDCIAPISVEYCSMCNRLISRKIFESHSILPFEGVNMWDDVGLAIRLRFYIRDTKVISKPYYHYNRMNEHSTTKRPALGRVMEQVECVKKLEQFFIKEKEFGKYERFLAYLKIVAKESLLEINPKLWITTFPEAKKYIYSLRMHFPKVLWIKYLLLSYCKNIGIVTWEFCSRLFGVYKKIKI